MTMSPKVGVAVVAALLLLGAPAAAAKASYREQSDRLVLGNEHIQLDLQGKKPLLQVSDPANASRGYQVFLQRLVEVPAGGGVQGKDVVASFDLQRAEAWQVNASQDAAGVTLAMQRQGAVDVRGPAKPALPVPLPPEADNLTQSNTSAGNATVRIVFHLRDQPATVQSGNRTLHVGTSEVKFDLVVEHWPWVNPGDVLALEFRISDDAAQPGPQAPSGDEVATQQNGERVGWVSWADEAQAWGGGAAQAPANVTVEHRVVDDQGAKHWLVYQAPGFSRLVHDPSVGLDPAAGTSAASADGKPVPGPETLGVLAASGLAAFAAARRKR